jgi:hypothetical protein
MSERSNEVPEQFQNPQRHRRRWRLLDEGFAWDPLQRYCRVSTADQARARQKRDPTRLHQEGWLQIVGFWEEVASGARLDRIKRKKVLHSMRAHVATPIPEPGRSLMGLR